MAKELGYIPSPAGPGKDSYSKSPLSGKGNVHQGNKKRQDGKNEDKAVNAGDHLFNADGEVNPDPENYGG